MQEIYACTPCKEPSKSKLIVFFLCWRLLSKLETAMVSEIDVIALKLDGELK